MLNIYVSPYGNDNYEGTSMAVAFRTITKAFSEAEPGSTIFLAEGTYPELVNITSSGNPILTQGIEGVIQGDLITVQPMLSLAEVQIGNDPNALVIQGNHRQGVVFKNVKIKGNTELVECEKIVFQNIEADGYLTFDLNTCSSVYFQNSKIDSVIAGGELAVDSRAGSDIRITNSVVTGSIHGEGVIDFKGTKVVGAYVSNLENVLVENAKFILGSLAFPASKNLVLHKTLVVANYLWNTTQDIVDIDKCTLDIQGFVDVLTLPNPFDSLMTSPGIRNSILYPSVGMLVYPEVLNFGFSYCLVKNLPVDPNLANTYANSCMEGINPRFVNAEENDYSLQDDSPCIDAADPMKGIEEGGGVRADIGYWEFKKSSNLDGGALLRDEFGSFFNIIYGIKESDPVIHQVLNLVNNQLHSNTIHNRTSLINFKNSVEEFEQATEAHLNLVDSFMSNQHTTNLQLNIGISSVYSLLLITRRDYFDTTKADTVSIAASNLLLRGLGLTIAQTASEVSVDSEKDFNYIKNISIPNPDPTHIKHAVNLDFAINGFDTTTETPRVIFVNQDTGDDSKEGLSAEDAVETIDRAFARCTRSRKNIIRLMGTGKTYIQDTTIHGIHVVIEGNGNTVEWNGNLVEDCIVDLLDVRYVSSNTLQFKRSKLMVDPVPSSFTFTGPGIGLEFVDSTFIFKGQVSGSFGINRSIKGTIGVTGVLISLIASTIFMDQVIMADCLKGVTAFAGSRGLIKYVGSGFGQNIGTLLTQDSSCSIVVEN